MASQMAEADQGTLIEGNGYETRQSSLLYVFVRFLPLPVHKTHSCLLCTEELTNRKVLVT